MSKSGIQGQFMNTATTRDGDLSNNVETLSPNLIVGTIGLLRQRIGERFQQSGLYKVCGQLELIAKNMEQRADWIGRPVYWLRYLTWGICILILSATLVPVYFVAVSERGFELSQDNWFVDLVTITEAGINDIVLIGAAIFFLLTIETRYKRERAIKALHELRSIAHVIDMHQLTKDPHRIVNPHLYTRTGHSPKLEMSQFELRRYLDYCIEMLSLTGKIAAVYVQEFDDGVAVATASELETLTTGLSRKIWQKISILHTVETIDEPSGSSPIRPSSAPDSPGVSGAKKGAAAEPDSPPLNPSKRE